MDFFSDFLPLLFSLVAIVAVLYLSYKLSKYLAKKVSVASGSNNIKVLERAALGQDKGLAVVEICDKYYLIGFSTNDIKILKDLPEYQPVLQSSEPKDFLNILKDTVKSKMVTKAGKSDDSTEKND